MAATNRQFNWSAVSVLGTAVTGVTSIDVDQQGTLAKFSGDGDVGPTTTILESLDPVITIVAADLGAIRSLAPGTRGAFAATHKDAKGASGGALTYTLASGQGILMNNPTSGQHRGFGQGRLILHTEWADSTTNPLSSALA